ncbi:MAG: DUF1553 domain-containing protein [Planctomycetota bacterium]|nr:DUF1553 domain-containing protein [Planctomycetota bacterium]
MKTKFLMLLCVLACSPRMLLAEEVTTAAEPDFVRDVLPILSNHCWSCHGPDAASRQADLRLDRRADALQAHGAVTPIVPGDPSASEVIRRVRASQDDIVMPPPDALKPLSRAQQDILQRWIAAGAAYGRHWAFQPPARPPLPAAPQSNWPRNAVDRFIFQRLQTAGLAPAAAAPRSTWLRRVTLDLTGLPPTLAELDAFLADDRPGAESRVVDRLFKSAAHAERMALHWLDAARYADTNGYNNDETRTMWPWRDWVIDAIQDGMHYDQFVTEQLAGDLLPGSTLGQRVATGFNRNHVLTTEGGVIPAEYQAEYVADRVHTAATVFMGISLQCARCHDHKFDPFTQRDFYRFGALFNNIPDTLASYGAVRMAAPVLKVPSRLQRWQLAQLALRQDQLTAKLETRDAALDEEVAAWEQTLTAVDVKRLGGSGLTAHFRLDRVDGTRTPNAVASDRDGSIVGPITLAEGVAGQALQLAGSTYVDSEETGKFDSADHFSLAAWFRPAAASAGAVLSKMNDANAFRGYDLLVIAGKVECHFVHHWPDNAFKVVTREPIALNEWHHVAVTYDGTRQASGLRLFVDGQLQQVEIANNNRLAGTLVTDKPFRIGQRQASVPFHGLIDEVQVFSRILLSSEVAQLAQGRAPTGLATLLEVRPPERSPAQRAWLSEFYSRRVDLKSRLMREELQSIATRIEAIRQAIPVTMIMQERKQRRPTHLLIRGQYDQPGQLVQPGLPASLFVKGAPNETTRLDLARWLTAPDHPLTARVAVNRWWAMLFGTGLVETAEDFGVQGARPSHPELLDWLATELMRQRWNPRAILKLIVLSATYRQSADVTPQHQKIDPQNRLLARAPRWRLPAETIRDNALAISGLLQRRIGGPSVRPYQPAGLWEDVSVETRVKYVADRGAGLYRRSMYTFWKRTSPPPSMLTFGAPDRETCVVRRARTNTPLQALVLLNDPTYVEAARVFAERIMAQVGDDRQLLEFAFRSVVARYPQREERTILGEMLRDARQRFSADPAAAGQLLAVGDTPRSTGLAVAEWAAWTSIASILLNLDETISNP